MLANKYEKKVAAADLPEKTKDQLRTFLDGREISDDQFNRIFDRVVREYQSTRIEAC